MSTSLVEVKPEPVSVNMESGNRPVDVQGITINSFRTEVVYSEMAESSLKNDLTQFRVAFCGILMQCSLPLNCLVHRYQILTALFRLI